MNVAKPAAASAAVVAAMLAASAWAWPQAPAQLPVHWGLDGAPDRWGLKAVALLVHPTVGAALSALFAAAPAVMPKRGRLERSGRAYALAWVGIVLLLALVHGVGVASALGVRVDTPRVMGVGTGLLVALLGDLMGKVRFNYVFGVRTPWTLADERVWDRTHRAVGPWFVAWGAVIALSSLAAGAAGLAASAGAGAVLVVVGGAVHSYVTARRLGSA